MVQIVWDTTKRLSNIETHGLDFADAAERFAWEEASVSPSYQDRFGRLRYVATGMLEATS